MTGSRPVDAVAGATEPAEPAELFRSPDRCLDGFTAKAKRRGNSSRTPSAKTAHR
jgi:hypothetical protein